MSWVLRAKVRDVAWSSGTTLLFSCHTAVACLPSRPLPNLRLSLFRPHSLLPPTKWHPYRPQIYVYARNARFFESDEESATKILEGHGEVTNNNTKGGKSGGASAASKAEAEEEGPRKLQAPSAEGVSGLVAVTGPPLRAPAEGSLAVVFFFATWCMTCEKVLPAILSVAARYSEDGETRDKRMVGAAQGREGGRVAIGCRF